MIFALVQDDCRNKLKVLEGDMARKPSECKNYLNTKLCDPEIVRRDTLKPINSNVGIPSIGADEMLKQARDNNEICGKCPNFFQNSLKA